MNPGGDLPNHAKIQIIIRNIGQHPITITNGNDIIIIITLITRTITNNVINK